jgi:maltose alpha-D-glucosyltransferase/alpha-amylase
MQWSSDKNAGFSRASPQALYLPIILDPEYHYEAVNVEAQRLNPSSLFWWMKRTLTLRKRYQAFGSGSLRFLHPENRKILAFVRQAAGEVILVVANLSRFHQPVHLDLSEFKEFVPVDLMGRAVFPTIAETPYFLTLGPHIALWFSLQRSAAKEDALRSRTGEVLVLPGDWEEIFSSELRASLEMELWSFLKGSIWFGGRARAVKSVQVQDAIGIPTEGGKDFLLIVLVEYVEGDPERYLISMALAVGEVAQQLERRCPHEILARVRLEEQNIVGILFNAVRDNDFCKALLESISRRRSFVGKEGEVKAFGNSILRNRPGGACEMASALSTNAQTNRGIVYGDKYFLKLFRRLEVGINPELEMGRFLTARAFPNVPAVVGALEYHKASGEEMTMAVATVFQSNTQDAWAYTLDLLSRYFDRVRTTSVEVRLPTIPDLSLVELSQRGLPEPMTSLIGTYAELARLLGQRTAELHLALASDPQDPAFAPEAFTPFYQRALFQSMRNLAVRNLDQLRRGMTQVPDGIRTEANQLISLQGEIIRRLRAVHETSLKAKRIRCHGDFHLGEVLFTGKDFLFIDFEGERGRPVGERRIKRSPLRDVAGMVRSFDYISQMALVKQIELGTLREQDLPRLEPWAGVWHRGVSAIYLGAYLKALGESDLLPRAGEQLGILFDAHVMEKALYEAGYELNNRPYLLKIPLRALLNMLRPKS